jgi:hypothetical protein
MISSLMSQSTLIASCDLFVLAFKWAVDAQTEWDTSVYNSVGRLLVAHIRQRPPRQHHLAQSLHWLRS